MVHKSDYVSTNGTPIINPANIVNGRILNGGIKKVSNNKVVELTKYRLSENDILLARRGDLKKCAIVTNSHVNSLCGTGTFFLHLIFISPHYFRNIYSSNLVQDILKKDCVGATMDNLNQSVLANIFIPIPPLGEQMRINKRLEYYFSLLNLVEDEGNNLQVTIKQAKSKILDLAIHGKLVPQDPSDEPANELLKRINPKAEITCDNPQYGKLPNGWCEVQLGDVFNHNTGKALNASNTEGSMKRYLTTSNVYWNAFDFTTVKQMYYKDSELDKCSITKGDLLVCEGGDVGRAAIWNFNYDICIQNHLHRLRPKLGDLCVSLYYYVFYYLKVNNMIGGKGIGLLGLSSNALHKLHVPLPPINEQHRIVAKIEELFTQLDKIEASL